MRLFCNAVFFLEGDSLRVRKESLREPSRGRKEAHFLPAIFVQTTDELRNLVVREQPPNCQYGTNLLTHPLTIPLPPPKHAF